MVSKNPQQLTFITTNSAAITEAGDAGRVFQTTLSKEETKRPHCLPEQKGEREGGREKRK